MHQLTRQIRAVTMRNTFIWNRQVNRMLLCRLQLASQGRRHRQRLLLRGQEAESLTASPMGFSIACREPEERHKLLSVHMTCTEKKAFSKNNHGLILPLWFYKLLTSLHTKIDQFGQKQAPSQSKCTPCSSLLTERGLVWAETNHLGLGEWSLGAIMGCGSGDPAETWGAVPAMHRPCVLEELCPLLLCWPCLSLLPHA
ncbi:hypothetical protein Anapl_01864 [Anas platyrhynchos]|uniref:Uncharacterized protein n=1 Tax=Anas platyrhynchos TaxID=8839 RepID=R0M3I8_ANAPL|nr:hypothetical protein Anapl_01864 [Anas platyrhynchos]